MNPRLTQPRVTPSWKLVDATNDVLVEALGLNLETLPGDPKRPRVWVNNVWLEAPIGDNWVVAYRIVVRAGRPESSPSCAYFPRSRYPL